MNRGHYFLIIVVILFSFGNASAQHAYPLVKNDTIYFDIEGVAKNVPLVRWSQEPYVLNDSVVCDLTYKKILSKLIVTTYNKGDFLGNGYAAPISLMKFKVGKAILDTTTTDYLINGALAQQITKHYEAKLKNKIDYFKYKSK